MPSRAIAQIKEEIGSLKGLRIGVLGITYRPGVKEVALSGAITLLQLLRADGAIVIGHDPFFSVEELALQGFDFAEDMSEVDGLILHTNHPEYVHYNFSDFANLKFLYDGRDAFSSLANQDKFKYLSI
jgi:UDP-N-acetyl-D-mannosaminuronate dehydrogenase